MASAGKKRKANVSLQDWVAEKLECPVCLQTIKDPPVFLCTNGHELCHRCREPLKAEGKPCPVCKGQLTDTRNRAVEKILEELPKVKCKHEGCTFERSETQLVKGHEEKECRMKPVKCEVCLQLIPLSQIYDHILTNHSRVPCSISRLGAERHFRIRTVRYLLLQKFQISLNLLNSDLKFFLNRMHYDTTFTMFWVAFCGTQMEADEYEYTIKIKNPTEQREDRKYLFTGTRDCVSCDVSHEDMKVKGDALLLNKALLERATFDKEGEFLKVDYCLVIKKKNN